MNKDKKIIKKIKTMINGYYVKNVTDKGIVR